MSARPAQSRVGGTGARHDRSQARCPLRLPAPLRDSGLCPGRRPDRPRGPSRHRGPGARRRTRPRWRPGGRPDRRLAARLAAGGRPGRPAARPAGDAGRPCPRPCGNSRSGERRSARLPAAARHRGLPRLGRNRDLRARAGRHGAADGGSCRPAARQCPDRAGTGAGHGRGTGPGWPPRCPSGAHRRLSTGGAPRPRRTGGWRGPAAGREQACREAPRARRHRRGRALRRRTRVAAGHRALRHLLELRLRGAHRRLRALRAGRLGTDAAGAGLAQGFAGLA